MKHLHLTIVQRENLRKEINYFSWLWKKLKRKLYYKISVNYEFVQKVMEILDTLKKEKKTNRKDSKKITLLRNRKISLKKKPRTTKIGYINDSKEILEKLINIESKLAQLCPNESEPSSDENGEIMMM